MEGTRKTVMMSTSLILEDRKHRVQQTTVTLHITVSNAAVLGCSVRDKTEKLISDY